MSKGLGDLSLPVLNHTLATRKHEQTRQRLAALGHALPLTELPAATGRTQAPEQTAGAPKENGEQMSRFDIPLRQHLDTGPASGLEKPMPEPHEPGERAMSEENTSDAFGAGRTRVLRTPEGKSVRVTANGYDADGETEQTDNHSNVFDPRAAVARILSQRR